jgi:hypothetical protein
MFKDGTLSCDSCHTPITRVVGASTEGWERQHNLCAPCFVALATEAA